MKHTFKKLALIMLLNSYILASSPSAKNFNTTKNLFFKDNTESALSEKETTTKNAKKNELTKNELFKNNLIERISEKNNSKENNSAKNTLNKNKDLAKNNSIKKYTNNKESFIRKNYTLDNILVKNIISTYEQYQNNRLNLTIADILAKQLVKATYKKGTDLKIIAKKISPIIYTHRNTLDWTKEFNEKKFKKHIQQFIQNLPEDTKLNNILKDYYPEEIIKKYEKITSTNNKVTTTNVEKLLLWQIQILHNLYSLGLTENSIKYLTTTNKRFNINLNNTNPSKNAITDFVKRKKIIKKYLNEKVSNINNLELSEYLKSQYLKKEGWSNFEIREYFSGNYKTPRFVNRMLLRAKNLIKTTNFLEICKKENVDPLEYLGIIAQESAFNPRAKSYLGAYGLAQLMDYTSKRMHLNRYDENQNLLGGAIHMNESAESLKNRQLTKKEKFVYTIIDYYAGKTNRDTYEKRHTIPIKIKTHVNKVLKFYNLFKKANSNKQLLLN